MLNDVSFLKHLREYEGERLNVDIFEIIWMQKKKHCGEKGERAHHESSPIGYYKTNIWETRNCGSRIPPTRDATRQQVVFCYSANTGSESLFGPITCIIVYVIGMILTEVLFQNT